jgi:hypothetical protein
MKITKVELDEFEQELIVAGLDKLASDADKIFTAAERLKIDKAAKEASMFKAKIKDIQDKVTGKLKLV